MNNQAYEKESIDYAIRGLMPDAKTMKLIGVNDEYKMAPRFSDKELHPIFIKALRDKYNGLTSEHIYKDLMQGYMEAWLNRTDRSVKHYEVWSHVLNITSSRALQIEKRIFPHDNLKSSEGIVSGTLYFVSSIEKGDVASAMSYRSVNKLLGSIYEDRKIREQSSLNYLQAFIDFGREAGSLEKNAIENLVKFYSEVNTRDNSLAFQTWIDEYAWDFHKDYIFEQAKSLKKETFAKFIDSDLPIKHWEEHVDMPREWLINLYKS